MNERNRECILRQLAAYDFAQVELNLFLDTHPYNKKALSEFNKVNQKAQELRNLYETEFGPLTTSAAGNRESWTWVNSPWPWEN